MGDSCRVSKYHCLLGTCPISGNSDESLIGVSGLDYDRISWMHVETYKCILWKLVWGPLVSHNCLSNSIKCWVKVPPVKQITDSPWLPLSLLYRLNPGEEKDKPTGLPSAIILAWNWYTCIHEAIMGAAAWRLCVTLCFMGWSCLDWQQFGGK